jgi:hypothetical protein
MKHTITTELFTCNKTLSITEEGKEVLLEIETFTKSKNSFLSVESFTLSKENLHSFIGTLLHVQSKIRK